MRSLIPILIILISVSASAETLRPDPSANRSPLRASTLARPGLRPIDLPSTSGRAALPSRKAEFTLNCENDNIIDLNYTLLLFEGDLAGSLLQIPSPGELYDVTEISIGLVDIGATYPTDIAIQIFLYDGSQFYVNIGAFVATITAPIFPDGTVVTYDLTPFELEVDDEILVLFGQHPDAGPPKILPASDSSPRCSLNGQADICSVVLPAAGDQFFIYGDENAEICTGKDPLLLADLVVELGVAERKVAVESVSFGAVKALYR